MIGLLALVAHAATLGALPTQIDAAVPPGEDRVYEVRVRSTSDRELALVARVWEIGQDGDGYAFVPPGTLARSAAAWCDAPDDLIPISRSGDGRVRVRVTVPASASGGYSAVLLLDAVPPDAPDRPVARIAIPVLVDTGTTGSADIQTVSIEPPTASTPLVIRTRAYNAGSGHALVQASAVVLDAAGKVVGRTLGSAQLRVLPGMTAVLEDRWGAAMAPGRYRAVVWLDGRTEALVETPFDVR